MGSVLSGIKVTLYDVFGYLLPGLVLLAAMGVIYWAVYLDGQPLAINDDLSIQTWALLLVAAYFLGHMAQALGNVIEERFPSFEKLILGDAAPNNETGEAEESQTRENQADTRTKMDEREPMPKAFVDKARDKARNLLGLPSDCPLDAEWLYRICDEAIAQRGQVQDREVYIYREGFYRASAIAFSFLSVSFLSLVSRGVLGWPSSLVLVCGSAVGAWLAYRRYVRFGCYRVRQAVIGFLALKEDAQTENSNELTTPSEVESLDSTTVVIEGEADWGLRKLFGYLR